MAVFVNTFFEKRVNEIFDLAERVEAAFAAAGLEYRVIGGLAAYLYVEEAAPDAGRLTRDIDIAVRREDLERIAQAVAPFGLQIVTRPAWTCCSRLGNCPLEEAYTWFSREKKFARSTPSRPRRCAIFAGCAAFGSFLWRTWSA